MWGLALWINERFQALATSRIVSQSRISRLMDNMVEKGYFRPPHG